MFLEICGLRNPSAFKANAVRCGPSVTDDFQDMASTALAGPIETVSASPILFARHSFAVSWSHAAATTEQVVEFVVDWNLLDEPRVRPTMGAGTFEDAVALPIDRSCPEPATLCAHMDAR